MSFNPDQPRNEDGEWAAVKGPSGGTGKPNKRMTIDQAASALAQHGWKLGKSQYDPEAKATTWELTHTASGKTIRKTAKEIMAKLA